MAIPVCVIGAGQMGTEHGRAWAARADAEVIAVFDPDGGRCKKLAGELGAEAFSAYEEAIALNGVEAVSVATPTCFHAEIACFALAHGRHVLCEKPLALSMKEADAMVQTARDHGVLLSTSLQYRDFSHNRRLKELVDSGVFGSPLFVRYIDLRDIRPKPAMHRRSMNNGPVLDMACHYFDFMRYLAGAEPATVFAAGHVFAAGKPRVADIDDLAIDAADIQVRYTNGHVLSVYVNWGMPDGYEFAGELIASPTSLAKGDGKRLTIVLDGQEEVIDKGWADPEHRIDRFAKAIHGEEELEVTGANGRIALAVSLAAFDSIETGRAVDVAIPPAE